MTDQANQAPSTDAESVDPTVLRALSFLGLRMPTTEQEVADLEEWAESQPLSDRMRSRDALLEGRGEASDES